MLRADQNAKPSTSYVRSMHNVGAVFRTADAFLVEKILLLTRFFKATRFARRQML